MYCTVLYVMLLHSGGVTVQSVGRSRLSGGVATTWLGEYLFWDNVSLSLIFFETSFVVIFVVTGKNCPATLGSDGRGVPRKLRSSSLSRLLPMVSLFEFIGKNCASIFVGDCEFENFGSFSLGVSEPYLTIFLATCKNVCNWLSFGFVQVSVNRKKKTGQYIVAWSV